MELRKLESILENISHEISQQIEFDVSILALSPPNDSNLNIITRIDGKHHKTKTFSNSIFQSFQILNGNLSLISKRDNISFVNKIVDFQNRKLKTSFVLLIDNKKVGQGALLIGSYHNSLLKNRQKLKNININSIISDCCNQKLVVLNRNNSKQEYYKQLFLHSNIATAVFDVDRMILLTNHKFEKLTGYNRNEIENRMTIGDFFSSSDQKRIREQFQGDCKLIRKNGEEKNIEIKINQIPNSSQFIVNFYEMTKYNNRKIEIREREEKDSIINKILTAINSNSNLDSLLKSLVNQLNNFFEISRAIIVLCDRSTSELQMFISDIDTKTQLKNENYDQVVEYLKSIANVETDLQSIVGLFEAIKVPFKNNFESQVCVKIKIETNVVGAFCITSDIKHAFSQYHIDILQGIADKIPYYLINTNLFHRCQQELEKYLFLDKISKRLDSCLNLDRVLQLIVKSTYEMTGAKCCRLQLLNEIDFVTDRFFSVDLNRKLRLAIQQGKPFIFENSSIKTHNIRSIGVFPIILHNKTIALLYLYFNKVHQFSNSELDFLTVLVNYAAVCINSARQYCELKQTEVFLKNMLKCSPGFIISITVDGKINFLNHNAQQILDYNQDEIMGRSIQKMMLNGDALFSKLRKNLLDSKTSQNIDFEILKKNGTFIAVNCTFSLLKNDDENVIGFIGTGRNIADYMFNQKNNELDDRMLDIFDKLKTPLVSQQGYISLLQHEYADKLDKDGQYYLGRIHKNIQSMDGMINDIIFNPAKSQTKIERN